MDPEAAEVKASGGVVWRRGAHGGAEVVVVHRPRYDDWSLPKGKLDPGETWEQAALREVEEEVGLRARLGEELPPVSYRDHKGRDKAVRYWLMEPEDDACRLHSERRGGRDALGGLRRGGGAADVRARRRAGADREGARMNRDRFPGLAGGWARLDGPAGTQMVDSAIDAMAAFMRSGDNANHGGVFAAAHATDACVEAARDAVARLLGAEPHGVAFGPSMTAMTMRLSAAVGRTLGPGDEVVVTRLDHDANVRPWVIAAERAGATVRWAEPDRDTLALPAAAVEAVLSDRTRWVAVTAASNATGTVPELDGHRRRRARRRRPHLDRRRRGRAAPRALARRRSGPTRSPARPTSGTARTSGSSAPRRRCSRSSGRTSCSRRPRRRPTGSSSARSRSSRSPG